MIKFYRVKITSGTALGLFDIYYDVINPLNYALLMSTSLPAIGLSRTQLGILGGGVVVEVPSTASTIIIHNTDPSCGNNIVLTIPTLPPPTTPEPTIEPVYGYTFKVLIPNEELEGEPIYVVFFDVLGGEQVVPITHFTNIDEGGDGYLIYLSSITTPQFKFGADGELFHASSWTTLLDDSGSVDGWDGTPTPTPTPTITNTPTITGTPTPTPTETETPTPTPTESCDWGVEFVETIPTPTPTPEPTLDPGGSEFEFTFNIDTTQSTIWGYFELYPIGVGNYEFDIGDGSPHRLPPGETDGWYDGIYFEVNEYTTPGTYTCRVLSNDTTFPSNIWFLFFYDMWLIDQTIDVSAFTSLMYLYIYHSQATQIIFPPTAYGGANDVLWGVDNFPQLQSLNLSNIVFTGTNAPRGFFVTDMDVLTNIMFFDQTTHLTSLTISNCHSLVTFDASNVSFFAVGSTSTNVSVRNNDVLTGFTLNISVPVYRFYVDNNPSLSYFDVKQYSNLTNISGTFNSRVIYGVENNNWSQAIVDQVLVDFDTISSGGYEFRRIEIGGTNAVPSATGQAAKTSLESKGFVVSVST